jgi:integrase
MSALSAPILRMPRKRVPQNRSRLAYFTAEQLEAFLKAARAFGAREHAMFLFGVSHGARASEIANLRLSDLNFKTGQVHVARLKGSNDSIQNFMKVKGNPLFDEEKAFRTWLSERKPDAGDFIFNSQKSTRLDRTSIYRLFGAVCEAAGIPKELHHPHVLKHSCAMQMVQQNVNAFMIRQHLGHRSFESTLQYVNASDKQASDACIRAFSQIF